MAKVETSRQVVIALTETTPVADLWQVATQYLREGPTVLTVVFLHDEHWHRAASLPFTREFSRVGGGITDFTLQRAEQLLAQQAASLRKHIDELASGLGLDVIFKVFPEADPDRIRTVLSAEITTIIGPDVLAAHPVFVELRSANKNLILIGPKAKGPDAG